MRLVSCFLVPVMSCCFLACWLLSSSLCLAHVLFVVRCVLCVVCCLVFSDRCVLFDACCCVLVNCQLSVCV